MFTTSRVSRPTPDDQPMDTNRRNRASALKAWTPWRNKLRQLPQLLRLIIVWRADAVINVGIVAKNDREFEYCAVYSVHLISLFVRLVRVLNVYLFNLFLMSHNNWKIENPTLILASDNNNTTSNCKNLGLTYGSFLNFEAHIATIKNL